MLVLPKTDRSSGVLRFQDVAKQAIEHLFMLFTSDFYDLIGSMMTKATKRRIRKAIKAKKCIRTDCTEPQVLGRRDLCKRHWNQYDYGRRCAKKRGAAALRKYERDEVSSGRVGPAHRGSSEKNEYKARATGAA